MTDSILSVPMMANKSLLIKLISPWAFIIFCKRDLYFSTLYCWIFTDTSPMYLNISESNIFGSSFTKQRTSSVKLSATDTDTGMCSFVKTVLLPC
ncbi:hypothetical protein Plhal304r1_c051g0134081 [Plasmopara halstedii]